MHAPTGLMLLAGRPPVQGVENSPPTFVGGMAPYVLEMRRLEALLVLDPDGSPSAGGSASILRQLLRVLHTSSCGC
jgi:hypothetical protein